MLCKKVWKLYGIVCVYVRKFLYSAGNIFSTKHVYNDTILSNTHYSFTICLCMFVTSCSVNTRHFYNTVWRYLPMMWLRWVKWAGCDNRGTIFHKSAHLILLYRLDIMLIELCYMQCWSFNFALRMAHIWRVDTSIYIDSKRDLPTITAGPL